MGKKSVSEADNSVVSEGEKENGLSYEEKLNYVSVIAKPMASKKLCKKLYKVIKKGKSLIAHKFPQYRVAQLSMPKLIDVFPKLDDLSIVCRSHLT